MRVGGVAAVWVTAATLVWVGLMATAPAPPPEADAAARLAFMIEHEAWHLATFAVVAPLALLYVPVWVGLAVWLWGRRPAAGVLGAGFGLVYAPFGLWGYWSQLTAVRGLADLHATEPDAALAAYQVLAFDGEAWSLSYGTAVLAYAIWGVAGAVMAVGLWSAPERVARAAGTMFALTGVLAVAGAVGFVAGAAWLEAGVMASGVTSVAASALTAVLLIRATRRSRDALGDAPRGSPCSGPPPGGPPRS